MRIVAFLQIPLEDIQRAVFADAGAVPDRDEHPGQPERKKAGRKKRPAVPLLEAAFRLYGWTDELEAAEMLGTTPEQVRLWRSGRERMDVADYLALTATVNVGLVDAMRAGRTGDVDISAAAEALGVRAGSPQ
jgi:hypothetical protein